VLWANNVSSAVTNLEIEAKLKGGSLDRSSVSAPRGFYRSGDDTIVWSSQTVSEFSSVEPGESGTVQFSFAPLGTGSGTPSRNQAVDIAITIRGQRLDENNVPEEVASVIEKRALFSSNLILTSKGTYSTGPFRNTGPIPPKADTDTTYTVTWSLSNSSNALSRAKVVGSLPPSVTWLGQVSPAGSVTFNPLGGVVTWNAGDIAPGVGFASSPKEVSFQISFRPSISQVGTAPVILNAPGVTADDQFTGGAVSAQGAAVTTEITSDPLYQFGQGFVGK
jgi:hypothetical protein